MKDDIARNGVVNMLVVIKREILLSPILSYSVPIKPEI